MRSPGAWNTTQLQSVRRRWEGARAESQDWVRRDSATLLSTKSLVTGACAKPDTPPAIPELGEGRGQRVEID
jgi:hypothetical protein